MKALRTTTVRQAKSQGNQIVGAIVADSKANNSKPIRPFDLRHLGYRFHDTPKVVFNNVFELRMVRDADTKHEVDFCFLVISESNFGVVLPHSFSHYMETYGESRTSLNAPVVTGEPPTRTTKA